MTVVRAQTNMGPHHPKSSNNVLGDIKFYQTNFRGCLWYFNSKLLECSQLQSAQLERPIQDKPRKHSWLRRRSPLDVFAEFQTNNASP